MRFRQQTAVSNCINRQTLVILAEAQRNSTEGEIEINHNKQLTSLNQYIRLVARASCKESNLLRRSFNSENVDFLRTKI